MQKGVLTGFWAISRLKTRAYALQRPVFVVFWSMVFFRVIAVLLLGLAVAFPQAGFAAWYWPFGQKGVDYKVEFGGVSSETYDWLKELKLDEVKDHVVESDERLEQELAVRGDRVRQALEALGYFDAVITQSVRRGGEKAVLVYAILQGLRYKVDKITMQWDGAPLKEIDGATLRSKVGEPVNAASIVEDAVDVLDRVGERACLLELDVSPLLRLYENRRRAELVFRIKHGAVVDFGATTVSGTVAVDKDVVLRSVTWKQGKCYREKKVDETRSKLIENQLFSSVSIKHPSTPDALGQVPMTVEVKERAARTLRAGAAYSTDEGVVVSSGWEHRNLFGGGEKFNADLTLGQEEQGLETGLRLPAFLGDEANVLALKAGISHEERDAYTADKIETGATLERKLARNWKGGLGVGFALTETEDTLAGNSEYGLLSFPGFVEYDTRRNVLDPRRGILANLTVTPYTETFGDGGQFLKTQGSFQTYISGPKRLAIPLSPTLALKVAGGTITGADGQSVPSDVRFYAGGGGSVRGYGYQTLGPRVNNEVVGGSSFVAGSAEARLRFTEELGGVLFMDAGNAYEASMPEEKEKLYTSVGAGVRYFTGIGPIRADLAIPMNGKDIGAAGYAVYISIGQSF